MLVAEYAGQLNDEKDMEGAPLLPIPKISVCSSIQRVNANEIIYA